MKKFETKMKELADRFKISEEKAGCYLCNFGDEYICRTYNRGCEEYKECKKIHTEPVPTEDTMPVPTEDMIAYPYFSSIKRY